MPTTSSLHRALDDLRDGVFVADADGRVMYANQNFARWLGPVGRVRLADHLAPADWAAVRGVLDGGPEVRERPVDLRRPDGGWTHAAVTCRPSVNGAGPLLAGVVRDTTERMRRELALAVLHEIDQRLLAGEAIGDILLFACRQIAETFEAAAAWIAMPADDGTMTVRAAGGEAAGRAADWPMRWDDDPADGGAIGRAFRTGRMQVVDLDPERARAGGIATEVAVPLTAGGQPAGVLALLAPAADPFRGEQGDILQMVADQVALSMMLAQQGERIRLQTKALEAAANAVVITDRHGRISWVNPAFTRLTGYAPEDVLGGTPRLLKSGEHDEAFYAAMWQTILRGETWQGEVINRRKDGTHYVDEQTITPVRDETGAITHFVAVKHDVSQRRRHEAQIRHMAMHDPLTNLPNRRALEERLDRAVARARDGGAATLLLLDLDDFKIVNDTVGHSAGDQFLRQVTEVMLRCVRPNDLLARIGGDEFAVILQDACLETAGQVGRRLQRAVDEYHFLYGEHRFASSVSIGMVAVDGQLDASGVLARADAALYDAKGQGANRIVVAHTAPDPAAAPVLASRWAARIKDALREHRFRLHYQPIVHLETDTVRQFEVLLRLQEDGRLIAPGEFLAAAERFDLMGRIDAWVVGAVLEMAARRPDVDLFVNISGASIGDADLLEQLVDRIGASGVDPHRLVFELTETACIRDLGRAQHWMERLRALGCRFALDDFGTGFCSFGYLRSLPVDFLKIDGSFTVDVDSDPATRAIVEAITGVGGATGKAVIAEHVERGAIVPLLLAAGVEYGQGAHWSLPGPELG